MNTDTNWAALLFLMSQKIASFETSDERKFFCVCIYQFLIILAILSDNMTSIGAHITQIRHLLDADVELNSDDAPELLDATKLIRNEAARIIQVRLGCGQKTPPAKTKKDEQGSF